jgi:hypothetical protein
MENRLEPEQLGESVGGAGTRKGTHASSHMDQHFTYSSQMVAVNDTSNDFRACDSSAPCAIIAFDSITSVWCAVVFDTVNGLAGSSASSYRHRNPARQKLLLAT